MVAGTILLIGLMLLVAQLMAQGATGEWPSITLASELGLPAEGVYSGWMAIDTVLRFHVNEVQLWLVLVFTAAVIYWLVDFADEQLARLGGRRRSARVQGAPAQDASPLAGSGTQA